MNNLSKISSVFILLGLLPAHGVSKSTVDAMADASLMEYVYFGAEHMVTGYDHILFLVGVLFFLTKYLDIFKFITAFTVAHCLTLTIATYCGITANAYLVDAVIAFSVMYKGFENLDGFKNWFSTNTPNLILMVFIFGLIHGFGLSTKLQEVTNDLSLPRIISFNVGVELGQIVWLLIIFPLLSILRGKYFDLISKVSNYGLIIAGIYLLFFQLNGYFSDHHHVDILKPKVNVNDHHDQDHHDHDHHDHDHHDHDHHDHDHHKHDKG